MQFDRTTPVTVAVRGNRGRIDITASDGVTVSADVEPLDDSDAAREAARNTQIRLDGDTLIIQPPPVSGWTWWRTPRLGITVHVPTGSSISAKMASAKLRATGRYHTAHVSTASGDAWIEDVTGDAHIGSASGDTVVGRIGGSFHGKSASGDIETGDVVGDVTGGSASGDISVRSVGGSVSAGTASGDIEVGVLYRGQANLRSASGEVSVGVAAGTGVWLDVVTASGSTFNDLAVSTGPAGGQTATLQLRIRTASGDVRIRRVAGGEVREAA